MLDPFLNAHLLLPHLYLLSPGQSPISIRDQMLRGRMLVERLVDTAEIPLLVVGAGAGGATAAMWSARKGVETWLLDRAPAPFALQAASTTRVLNPTQYDWPVNHWTMGKFPWNAAPMPLDHPVSPASALANRWTTELNNFQTAYSKYFHIRYDTEVKSIQILASGQLQVSTDPAIALPDFGAVIWAAGTTGEETRVKKKGQSKPLYEGRAFWSSDPFTQANCGLANPPKVLIAGSGDGALQDFLRVATGLDTAEAIYRSCNIPLDVEQRIHSAEDRALRCWPWGMKESPYDHEIQAELQSQHERAVRYALRAVAVRRSLTQLLSACPPVQIVYPCTHFTAYYGLNRFLALLIARYLEHENAPVLCPGFKVTDVSTANTDQHACMQPASNGGWEPAGVPHHHDCHGRPHEVTVEEASSCTSRTVNPMVQTLPAEVIIIRYGFREATGTDPLAAAIANAPLILHPTPTASRHSLPFHRPA